MNFEVKKELLQHFEGPFSNGKELYSLFTEFTMQSKAYSRENLFGHFTASAFVFDPEREVALLMEHKKLKKWLQPGGHADGCMDLFEVAKKELEEETGLNSYEVVPGVFDIHRHDIPTYKDVPEHFHYDVRFLFLADSQKATFVKNHESTDLAWLSFEQFTNVQSDESVRRMFNKALKMKEEL